MYGVCSINCAKIHKLVFEISCVRKLITQRYIDRETDRQTEYIISRKCIWVHSCADLTWGQKVKGQCHSMQCPEKSSEYDIVVTIKVTLTKLGYICT